MSVEVNKSVKKRQVIVQDDSVSKTATDENQGFEDETDMEISSSIHVDKDHSKPVFDGLEPEAAPTTVISSDIVLQPDWMAKAKNLISPQKEGIIFCLFGSATDIIMHVLPKKHFFLIFYILNHSFDNFEKM